MDEIQAYKEKVFCEFSFLREKRDEDKLFELSHQRQKYYFWDCCNTKVYYEQLLMIVIRNLDQINESGFRVFKLTDIQEKVFSIKQLGDPRALHVDFGPKTDWTDFASHLLRVIEDPGCCFREDNQKCQKRC